MPFDLDIHLRLLTSIISIVFINIVLSGDNAVVIAMASRRLHGVDRWRAVLIGGAGAVGLRVVFTLLAALLLRVPLLQLVGGVLLVWIAYRLLAEEGAGADIAASATLWGAVQTIALADFLMSLDNILAVGGASHGSFTLLLFGLALSMPLVLIGSSVIASLMERYRWLTTIGAVILAITAARMVADDRVVRGVLNADLRLGLTVALAIVFSLAVVLLPRLRHAHDHSPPAPA